MLVVICGTRFSEYSASAAKTLDKGRDKRTKNKIVIHAFFIKVILQ